MNIRFAGIIVGVLSLLVAPQAVTRAETGSAGTGSAAIGSGGSGSSGSGSVGSGSGSSSGDAPSYAQWIADIEPVATAAADYLAARLPGANRPAVVFDIDNTTLETHYNLGLVIPAIPSMLRLARAAEQQGAAIFFVTARPFLLAPVTAVNLSAVGYPVDGVYDRGLSSLSAGDYQDAKTASRIQIEKLGYTIVANIGNSASDLAGGHAERTFKLPDYDGALS